MLRIHLFGNPQIFYGDTLLTLPTPNKVLALWAYLLLKRQQPLLRDHLAYLLWPDVTEAEARANLRRHLHLLRKQLPAPAKDTPWILTTHQTIQWNPAATYWLDVAVLEEFDPAEAEETIWTDLSQTYRGDLLAGFYDDWMLAERDRLQQRYLQLLTQRIAAQKQRGNWPGAIDAARRLLAADTLREEPYRELMEMYYRAGDRAAALGEFEKCRTMLHVELQAEPMPETLALRQAILNGEKLPPVTAVLPMAAVLPPKPAPTLDRPQPAVSLPAITRRRINRKWLGIAGLLLLVLLAAGLWLARSPRPSLAPNQQMLTLSGPAVTQDTWIDKDNPDLLYDPQDSERTPKAAYAQVHLSYFGYPFDRVLIRFDLAQLPPNAIIHQAVFHQHLDVFINEDLPEPLPATVSAFRLLRPWQADTATFNTPWSQPGLAANVDYDAQPLGSHSFHGETWVSLDITNLVQQWVIHPDQNFGLMLMITQAPQGAHYWVDTSDYPLTDRRPHLDITYTP
ncbi:MAG: DNRLRE domain-containing protein [Anaerolineae bacterium]|nr:DNRLRE domain-containing protein [Anaerolineae bacterium]